MADVDEPNESEPVLRPAVVPLDGTAAKRQRLDVDSRSRPLREASMNRAGVRQFFCLHGGDLLIMAGEVHTFLCTGRCP